MASNNIDSDETASVISHEDEDLDVNNGNGAPPMESPFSIQDLIEQLQDKENALDCTKQLVQNLTVQVEHLQLENEQLRQQSQHPVIATSSVENQQDQAVVATKLGPTSGAIARPPSCASGLRFLRTGLISMSDSSLTSLSQGRGLPSRRESPLGDRFALQRSAYRPTEATMTTTVPTMKPSSRSSHGIPRPPSCASGLRLLYGGMLISSTVDEHEQSIENNRARVVEETLPNPNAEMFELRRNSDNNKTPGRTEGTANSAVARIPSSARILRGFSTSSISTITEGTARGIRKRSSNNEHTTAPRKRNSTNVRASSFRARDSDHNNEDWGDVLVLPPSSRSRGANALLRKANSLGPDF